ncbi:MAG: polysaccharide deacetylase family protein [Actinomycetota bacterium]|nr:polysaccharide deacetylase family protein [Actinomycetota bacterium]
MRRRGRTIILLYHRVTSVASDPFGLCVRPDRFAEQLRHLRRMAAVVPLRRCLEPSSGCRVALTFDDGYHDNATEAAPMLQSGGLPATFFVTAGMLDRAEEYWWDRLEGLLSSEGRGGGHLDLMTHEGRLWVDVRSPGGRRRALWALHRRLRFWGRAEIRAVLDQVARQLGADEVPRETHRAMTTEELLRLAAGEGCDIGAHTVSHPSLLQLPDDQQFQEVAESRQRLEALLGRPVEAFSYPFGGSDAWDTVTVGCVRRAGFRLACTALAGAVPRRPHPLTLPRHYVRDWSGLELAERLRRWFAE